MQILLDDIEDKKRDFKGQRWEYKSILTDSIDTESELKDLLNWLGEEGWELVSVVPEPPTKSRKGLIVNVLTHRYVFKRAVNSQD